MHHTQRAQEIQNKVLADLIEMNKAFLKQEYRRLHLIRIPKKNIRVPYDFYRN